MKKLGFILGGLFLLSIALTSCKKDWVCECTDKTDNSKTNITYTNTTKKLASDACKLLDDLNTDNDCVIK